MLLPAALVLNAAENCKNRVPLVGTLATFVATAFLPAGALAPTPALIDCEIVAVAPAAAWP